MTGALSLQLDPARAARLLLVAAWRAGTLRGLGDFEGHPFRGNQYVVGYHVTLTKNASKIAKKGITQFNPSNWVKGSPTGERYGEGEVYAFEHPGDAVAWAAKMDWEHHKSLGTGKVSVVKFKTDWAGWTEDTADPIAHAGAVGKWYKKMGAVPPEDIIGSVPVVTEHIQKTIKDRSALKSLGDRPGHEFHGNQWTERGSPGAVEPRPYTLDERALDTEAGAAREFQRAIRTQYPSGLPVYHETTLELAEQIKRDGLWPEMFATVGTTANFIITPDKAVVFVQLTPRESRAVSPDMRYYSEGVSPETVLLREHGGVRGADISLNNEHIPASRVEVHVVRGGEWRELGDYEGHPFHGNQWTEAAPSSRGGYSGKRWVLYNRKAQMAYIRRLLTGSPTGRLHPGWRADWAEHPQNPKNRGRRGDDVIDQFATSMDWPRSEARKFLGLGDFEGHPFHGNQWTGGLSGAARQQRERATREEIRGVMAITPSKRAINPDKEAEYVAENKAILKRWGARDVDEYMEKVDANLREVVPDAKVMVRMNVGDLSAVLSSGELQNAFQTHTTHGGTTAGGHIDYGRRAHVEEQLFGIAQGEAGEGRPKYGYLASGNGFDDVNLRGGVAVELKDSVKDRTTFTVGDSADMTVTLMPEGLGGGWLNNRTFVPQPVRQPSILAVPSGRVEKPVTRVEQLAPYDYVEAQVHGRVAVSDIKSVSFAARPSRAIASRLERLGIPVKVVNKKVRHLGDYEGHPFHGNQYTGGHTVESARDLLHEAGVRSVVIDDDPRTIDAAVRAAAVIARMDREGYKRPRFFEARLESWGSGTSADVYKTPSGARKLTIHIPGAIPEGADLDDVTRVAFTGTTKWYSETGEVRDVAQSAVRSFDDVVVHEMAHVQRFDPPTFREAAEKLRPADLNVSRVRDAAASVSNYAAENSVEFVAEAFTRLYRGEKLSPEAQRLYDVLGGPAANRKKGVA